MKPGSRSWRQAAKEGGQTYYIYFHLITIFLDFVVSECLVAYLPHFDQLMNKKNVVAVVLIWLLDGTLIWSPEYWGKKIHWVE